MFRNILKTRRKELGLTQRQLSFISGLSHTYISDIETGRSSGTIETIKKLCEALEIENYDILKEE